MEQAKHLVINGLYGSGTTMLERLIDSQKNMLCFSHLLEMPYVIARASGNHISKRTLELGGYLDTDLRPENVPFQDLHRQIAMEFAAYMMRFNTQFSDYTVDDANQSEGDSTKRVVLHGMTVDTFSSIFKEILKMNNFQSMGDIWSHFSDIAGAKVIGSKWTACHRYAPIHLRDDNCYWIEVIRSPYNRYGSVNTSYNHGVFDSSWETNDQFEFASKFKHGRYRVVRYEDICDDSESALRELSGWIEEEIKEVPLLNYFGSPFRPNTAANVLDGKDKFYQKTAYNNKIGSISNKWINKIHQGDLALINDLIDFHSFYEKVELFVGARILAKKMRYQKILFDRIGSFQKRKALKKIFLFWK